MGRNKFAVVILAAGNSSRLGSPKQLLMYQGKSLLRCAIDESRGAGADQLVVVGGALDLADFMEDDICLVKNEQWEEGMASSIRCGVEAVQERSEMEYAIIMVCDQPYADREVLKGLVELQQRSGKPIVASEYGGRAGTPALFHRSFFTMLMQLKGDVGARHLIADHKELVAFVGFPKGITDIDTLRDYEAISEK
jgi:molybdenum cofactor cytidylyltransferase